MTALARTTRWRQGRLLTVMLVASLPLACNNRLERQPDPLAAPAPETPPVAAPAPPEPAAQAPALPAEPTPSDPEAERGEPAPSEQAQAEPDAQAPPGIACEGWLRSGATQSCMYVWTECNDGQVREVRCSRSRGKYACYCVAGAELGSFTSPDFCTLGGHGMSIDRAIFTERAAVECGWDMGPERRRAARAPVQRR